METEVSKQNIADIVEEGTSHFRFSPFFSRVYKLRGLNIASVTDVEDDAEYSLNLGFMGAVTDLKKSINVGGIAGGASWSEYSLILNGLMGYVGDLEKSIHIGGIGALAENAKYSLNIGGFAQVCKYAERSLNIGVYAQTKNLKNSANIGLLAGDVRLYAENSIVAGIYTRAGKLLNSLECGIINFAKENLGRQIGLVNICRSRKGAIEGKEAKGRSIGLVNIDLGKPWYDSVSFFYR